MDTVSSYENGSSSDSMGVMWIILILVIIIIITLVIVFWFSGNGNGNGNGSRGPVGPAGPPGPQGPAGPQGPPGNGSMEDAVYFSGVVQLPQPNAGVTELVVQLGLDVNTTYTFMVSITIGSGTISPFTFSPSSPNGGIAMRYETFSQGSNMILRIYQNETNATQGILSIVAVPVDSNVITNGINTINNFGNSNIQTLPAVSRQRPVARGRTLTTAQRTGRRFNR